MKLYLKYVTVLSKNEPFLLKYYRFTTNCTVCKVRTSASVAFINSPSISSLNYSFACISHAKRRIFHIHQQNKKSEKDPTVYASNDKKNFIYSLLFHPLLSYKNVVFMYKSFACVLYTHKRFCYRMRPILFPFTYSACK